MLTCSPTFPNSFGSLGYAVRIRIELEPVSPYVALRHVRFDDLDRLAEAIATVCRDVGLGRTTRSTSWTASCSPPTRPI